jgi:glycosyltransferase involved in cell wall biosynthesis
VVGWAAATVTPAHSEIGRRVALVANPSADLYGSDRMMLETVRGLVELGWTVVVATSQSGPLDHELKAAGADVVVCPAPVVRRSNLSPTGLVRLAADGLRGLPAMVRLVRRVRPDVVYVNTVTVPLWLVVARLMRVPSAIHIHEAEGSASTVARYGLTVPTRLANRVICNSQASLDVAAVSGGRRDHMQVISNGVGGPPEVRPPRDVVPDPRLLFVGRLSPRKGVDVAVLAVSALRALGFTASLDVVGAVFPGYEWYERELADLVTSEGLSEQVTLHGFTADVWPHLRDADVVLVPSRAEESFGNGVIEAALSARPVVVSDHTGLREAAGHLEAAVAVPADQPDAIAEAVVTLLGDWPQTRERALRDATESARRYAPERYRREVGAVLESLAATR